MTNLDRLTDLTLKLNAVENDLLTFFELSNDLFLILDDQGKVQKLNPAWKRILGYEPDTLVGKSAGDLIHPEDRVIVRERYAEAIKSEAHTYQSTCRMKHRDGHWVVVMWQTTPLVDRRLYGVGRDMTEATKYVERFERIRRYRHNIISIIEELDQNIILKSELSRDRLKEIYDEMKAET